ncbi:hypothetical protein [Streptomyces sp. MS1.AVA.4]|uniref:Uncharacterized protein n=1 Tax=Streptomyces pratisoli TaxID=3139917 RepID=A0ACC6QV04_9ACTN
MEDLKYKMIMALAAADLGKPLCEQVAGICTEVADQHCTQLHVPSSADQVPEIPVPSLSRAKL